MEKRRKGYNILFKGVILIFTVLLMTFVILSVLMVFIKGIPNLKESFQTTEIKFALKLSLFTSFISTILCIIFAVPIGYGLARFSFLGKKIVNAVFNIPMALPPIVAGISLLILFGNTGFGNFLENLGLKFIFTVKGIILVQFFINVPYTIRIVKSTIQNIDPRIEFISRTLGCTNLTSFMTITLPLAKNGILASIIITWARALGDFGAVLMIAGATRMKTETLPTSIYLNMSCGDLNTALSVASILIIISLISLFIFELLGEKYL
ncbi:ABC transporter permease subunit [Crassaminicella thermophila]|uniref:ABC transporter permease subunit n=1 Tax=Crassaminicella thermophila TaxID=2599308 RepID=A0A5C0SFX6_CRATE|nr:ABC transporter permease [Crassaminicella thermophila]QEK13060.1 ABC transporter permease subunit [Crassaminicella thermophila]